jgi:hypothetical protein
MGEPKRQPAVVISQNVSSVIDEVPLLGSRCGPFCQTAKVASKVWNASFALTLCERLLASQALVVKLTSESEIHVESCKNIVRSLSLKSAGRLDKHS